jgi:hypothetical protein
LSSTFGFFDFFGLLFFNICPTPLAPTSVRYCEKHLAAYRERARVKAKKLNKPPHGRAPGSVAALAVSRKNRKQKSNA